MKEFQKDMIIFKEKKNIIRKIKEWIKNLFSKQEIVEKNIFSNGKLNKQDFNERIQIVDEYKEEKILKSKIDKKEILISDLTNIQKERLINFYRKQNKLKRENLKQIKSRILEIKDNM